MAKKSRLKVRTAIVSYTGTYLIRQLSHHLVLVLRSQMRIYHRSFDPAMTRQFQ